MTWPGLRTSAWQIPLAALLCACSQESFLLGALEKDAGSFDELDASSEQLLDGATPDDGGHATLPSPLYVDLEARGREGVIAVSVGCGTECVTVRANVTGGVPPYRVTWDDGKQGAARMLCGDPQRPRGGVVQDASSGVNAPVTFSLAAIDYLPCNGEPPSYRVCFAATPVQSPCPERSDTAIAFDLGEPLAAGSRFTADLVVRGASRSGLAYATLYTFSDACDDQQGYAGNSQNLNPAGDAVRLQFQDHIGPSEVRYLALDDQSLNGFPPVNGGDAGVLEVESLVVCEYSDDGTP